jgi:hypothetical protein
MVPSDSPIKLNTSYFSDLIPPLYQKYPNLPMQLNCSVSQMPVCQFNSSGANINANSIVDVYVKSNNNMINVFTLNV